MRNLKKLLAVVVAVCVLATMSIPAFAAETTAPALGADAQICKDLGVLKGDSADGVTDTYLAKGTSRLQAAILYLRLIGKEADALAYTGTEQFADVDGVWAGGKAILGYLKANPTLGWQGIGDNKFDPNGAASAQMIYKVALEALGYKQGTDFEYADAITFAAGKGMTKIADVTTLTNGSTATALVEVLNAKLKDGSKTLAADLVAKGVFTQAQLDASGLVPAVALDVSGAVALNSKVVEVSLGTAATAADVAAATIAVKDAAAKAIAVTKAELAPWSTDGKSVLVTLGADTTAGTLYTMTIGAKSVNFGGKPVDTTKPTATVKSTDYNEVTVTFSEAIRIETAKVTIAKSYGDKAALATTAVKYNGSDKLVFATADQADATLYTVTVESATDLAGNVIDKDDDLTFVGQGKPTGDQEVVAAKALDYKTIYVAFNVNVDPATAVAANFKLEEMYGTKAVIAIADAKMATATQAGKYSSANNTDDLKNAAAKKAIVLTLTGEVKNATLYKVTASGVKTLYGKALSSTEAKTYTTFTGKSKPASDSLTYTAAASSNTKVKLTFANDLDEASAETVANYSIAKAYGDKAALAVSKAELSDGNIVTLTVAAMAIDMYKLTATGIKDIYGNSIKTADDANIQSFAGKAVAGKIDGIDSIVDTTATDGKIRVTFNKNYGDGALDVASYSLDNGIGYPSKAAKVDGSDAAIDLTIPKTETGTIYKLTVKGVKNSDGVAMDADGISKTFVGLGGAAAKPELEAAYAVDSKTMRLYFTKNVEDITGLKNDDPAVMAGNIAITGGAAVTVTHAYVDPADKKVIIAYTTTGDFKDGGSDDTYTVDITGTGLDTDHDSKTFAENTSDAAKIKVDGVVAVNDSTIDIYFNQPVRFLANGFASVTTSADAAFATITNLRATNDAKTVYEASLSAAMDNVQYKLVLAGNVNTLISNIATGVTLNAVDTDTLKYSFAGNDSEDLYVKDVYAVGVDTRTIKVYYPEAMNEGMVENTANYTVVDGDSTPNDVTAGRIVLAEYDGATHVVTLTTNGNFTASDNGYFLKVANTVENALGTKHVKTDATTDLKKEFALGTADPAKLKIKEVTTSGQAITVKFNQRFTTATDIDVAAELVKYLAIKVNGTTAIAAGDIAGVVAKLDAATVANSSLAGAFIDNVVITVTPALTLNGQGSVELINTAAATAINGQAQDTDQDAIVFAQK